MLNTYLNSFFVFTFCHMGVKYNKVHFFYRKKVITSGTVLLNKLIITSYFYDLQDPSNTSNVADVVREEMDRGATGRRQLLFSFLS